MYIKPLGRLKAYILRRIWQREFDTGYAWAMDAAIAAPDPRDRATFIADIGYESAAYQRGVAAAVDDVKRYAVKGRKRDE
jgi:hypothetical protein